MRPLGRIVTAAIGQAGANGVALLGFRTAFDVAYSGTSSPGTATIRVWNAPSELITAAFAGPLPTAMVTAGHIDADSGVPMPALPLFIGDVSEFTIVQNGVDRVLEIKAATTSFAWQRARFVYTSPALTSYASLVPIAVAQAGLVLRGLTPTLDVPMPLGAYVDESFRTFMDRATEAMGARWGVFDGKFVDVWPSALASPTAFAAVLDPSNIIGQPRLKKGKVEVRALLNGKLRPGSSFTIVAPTAPGTYVATDVKFVGDSGFDTAFYVDLAGSLLVG